MSAILFALLKGSVYTLQPSTIQGNNWGGEQPLNWRVYQQSHHSVLNTMSAILFALLKGSVYTLQPSTIQAITNQENEGEMLNELPGKEQHDFPSLTWICQSQKR